MATYCVSCHSGQTPAAQLSLDTYSSLADVVRDHPRWALVGERIKAGDMPPKPMKHPEIADSKRIIDWIEAMRSNEARKHAGDPGIVLARRLSNAEYNYTIRDLTGIDMQPTKEFPVDPANPEGFDNTGESLSMSPALLNKYLQAARSVANQLVLKPNGIDFAPHPMLVETDREKYAIQRIDVCGLQHQDLAPGHGQSAGHGQAHNAGPNHDAIYRFHGQLTRTTPKKKGLELKPGDEGVNIIPLIVPHPVATQNQSHHLGASHSTA